MNTTTQDFESIRKAEGPIRNALLRGDVGTAKSLAKKVRSEWLPSPVVLGVLLEDESSDFSTAEFTRCKKLLRIHNSLISRKIGLIFTPIAKNACSLLKTMMVEHGDAPGRFAADERDLHAYLAQRDLPEHDLDEATWDSPDFRKAVVLRNPFHRLVSGYLNKIGRTLAPKPPYQPTVRLAQLKAGVPLDDSRSISFAEFVRYVCSVGDMQMDHHWRPQSWFIQGNLSEYDLIGRFEDLEEILGRIESECGIRVTREIKVAQIQNYRGDPNRNVADRLPQQAITDGKVNPPPSAFYTDELRMLVEQRYAQDIQLYEQAFGIRPTTN